MNKDVIDTFLDAEPVIDYNFEEEPDTVLNYDTAVPEQEPDQEYTPPAYTINNGIALYSQLAQILAVYYHAKHSEPICDVFEPVTDIQQFTEAPVFHL